MKDTTSYVLAPGVIVEDLGADSAVLIPGTTEVFTLSGDAAEIVRRIRAGEPVEAPDGVVADLLSRGVIAPAAGMSRRGVVRAGVIGAGAGIAALAMPSVAAASSPGGSSNSGGFSQTDWFTELGGTSVTIAARVGSPPWGSGKMPTTTAVAGALPDGFTEPSALTVPGFPTPFPFKELFDQGPESTETTAVWTSPSRVSPGVVATFTVNSVTYEVLLQGEDD